MMGAISTITAAAPSEMPLRALQLFDFVPMRHVVHAVEDRSGDPFIKRGEIVIADRMDNDASTGGLFLIEHGQNRSVDLRSRTVVEISSREHQGVDGKPFTGWWLHPPARASEDVISQARRTGAFFCSDGPFASICHVNALVVGRIVGLYDPVAVRSAS